MAREEPTAFVEEPFVPIGSLVGASMVSGVHGSHGLQRKRSQLAELQWRKSTSLEFFLIIEFLRTLLKTLIRKQPFLNER